MMVSAEILWKILIVILIFGIGWGIGYMQGCLAGLAIAEKGERRRAKESLGFCIPCKGTGRRYSITLGRVAVCAYCKGEG